MYIYILLFFLPIFFLMIFPKKEKKISLFMSVFVFMLLALRDYSVGTDLNSYKVLYEFMNKDYADLLEYFLYYKTEPLYLLVVKTCSIVSNGNFRFFLVITGLIFAVGSYKVINLYSKKIWLSWMTFIAFGSLSFGINLMKASFAFLIGMYVSKYWIKDEYKETTGSQVKFTIGCIIAALFHYTSVIYFFLPLLYKFRKNHKKLFRLIFPVICIVAYLSGKIFTVFLASKFYSFKSYEIESSGGEGLLIVLLIMLIINLAFVSKREMNVENEIIISLIDAAIIIQTLAFSFNLWARISAFIIGLISVMYSDSIIKFRFANNGKKIIYFVYVFALMIFYLHYLINETAGLVPYVLMCGNR